MHLTQAVATTGEVTSTDPKPCATSSHAAAYSASSSKTRSTAHLPRPQRPSSTMPDMAISSPFSCSSLPRRSVYWTHLAVRWFLAALPVILLLVLLATVQAHDDFSTADASSPLVVSSSSSPFIATQNRSLSSPETAGSDHFQLRSGAPFGLLESAKQKRSATGQAAWSRFAKRLLAKAAASTEPRLSARQLTAGSSADEGDGSTVMDAIREMRNIGHRSSLINRINNDNEQIDGDQVQGDSSDGEAEGEPAPLPADRALKGGWVNLSRRGRPHQAATSSLQQVNSEWRNGDWSWVPLVSLYRNALFANVTEPSHWAAEAGRRVNPSEARPVSGGTINNNPDGDDSDLEDEDDYELGRWNRAAEQLLLSKRTGEPFRKVVAKRRLVMNGSNGARLYVDPARGIDFPSEEEAEARGILRPNAHPRRPPRPHPKPTPAPPTARPYQRYHAGSPTTSRPERALLNFTVPSNVNRYADNYYEKAGRGNGGHRYYQTTSRTTSTTPRPESRGRDGSQADEQRSNSRRLNKWNRNQMANLYKTNRTAWEIEFKKQQEFSAEARRKGHVYGFVINRGSRAAGGKKLYDVPQVECPSTESGVDRFSCPTPDMYGRFLCIDDQHICNGYIDCPKGEDEDSMSCMFYRSTKAHLDVLADYLLQWARGRHY